MRLLYFSLLFLVALVLQTVVVPVSLPFWFASALDLPLLVAVHIAITRSKAAGMFSGTLLGYLQDSLSAGILGVNGLAKILAGYTGGFLREKFFTQSPGQRFGTMLGAVAVGVLGKFAVLQAFSLPSPSFLSPYLPWTVFLNTVLGLAVSAFLNRLEVRLGITVEEEISLGG